jgi:hypothetical protein
MPRHGLHFHVSNRDSLSQHAIMQTDIGEQISSPSEIEIIDKISASNDPQMVAESLDLIPQNPRHETNGLEAISPTQAYQLWMISKALLDYESRETRIALETLIQH